MDAYTTADVAAALGVAASTVRAYGARGQMPEPTGIIGRTPYWFPEDIEPWIERQRANRRHPRNPQPAIAAAEAVLLGELIEEESP